MIVALHETADEPSTPTSPTQELLPPTNPAPLALNHPHMSRWDGETKYATRTTYHPWIQSTCHGSKQKNRVNFNHGLLHNGDQQTPPRGCITPPILHPNIQPKRSNNLTSPSKPSTTRTSKNKRQNSPNLLKRKKAMDREQNSNKMQQNSQNTNTTDTRCGHFHTPTPSSANHETTPTKTPM